MKRILLIEHAQFRAEGFIQAHKELSDLCQLDVWRCHEEDEPPYDDPDGIILSGGPMMVEDLEANKFPFYQAEIRLIDKMISENKPVLGVCLGSQILCSHLGGSVRPAKWVVGWQVINPTNESHSDPVFRNIEEQIRSFQYHRDHFTELPQNSVVLCSSPNSSVEAFRVGETGQVWGCVFHPEMDVNILMDLYDATPHIFTDHGISRQELAPFHDGRRARRVIIRNFFKLVANQ